MHMQLTPDDLAFQAEVRAFLQVRLTPDLRAASARNAATFCDLPTTVAWHKTLYEKGWVAPDWPTAYGGCGWTPSQLYIFAAELARAGAPAPLIFGLKMCGPVLMRFGTSEQKEKFLPAILSGDHRWCQGYSEPGAGSDLASLATRAERDGDDYIVNGSKIWTTLAHQATHMFCLVRTDRASKAQRGISFLLIDMTTPGVRVTPIINIAGDHEFNQVHFDNVRVPAENLVGEEGSGWTVAKYLLEFERGGVYSPGLWARHDWVKRLALSFGTMAELSSAIASTAIEVSAVEMLERRVIAQLSAGATPGRHAPMLKLQGSELTQRLDELALAALGPMVGSDRAEADVAVRRYLYDRSVTIYGGCSEIQRNIMARDLVG